MSKVSFPQTGPCDRIPARLFSTGDSGRTSLPKSSGTFDRRCESGLALPEWIVVDKPELAAADTGDELQIIGGLIFVVCQNVALVAGLGFPKEKPIKGG